ncbi:MAG: MFS transporter [Chloroflexi bacterium]|nr:MFS transporter [Chloroflexota bacterium]
MATPARQERLFTPPFLLTSASTFAFFSSFQLQLPTLPLYILFIGGNESQIGLILGIFTVTSITLRPFVGRASDVRGRRIFMLVGAIIFIVAPLLYGITSSIPILLALRLFHGVGIACFTTTTTALIADISPVRRRGEAMGYFGMFSNLAMAIAPALGIVILTATNFVILFVASAGLALLALILAFFIREPRGQGAANNNRAALFSRPALIPTLLVTCLTLTYGAVISFLPLYAVEHGLANPGFFFTAYAVALILARAVAGNLSDRFGRGPVLLPGFLVLAVATGLLGMATSLTALLLLGFLYGVGFGSIHPALSAYLLDHIGGESKGAAMGTFTAGFDLGIGAGSIVGGFLAEGMGLSLMFGLAALPALAGPVIFVIRERGWGLNRAQGAEHG